MTHATVIAIDGPGASGKSTVGHLVAQELGYRFIDTGGMYRALTWLGLRNGLDFNDAGDLAALARDNRLDVRPGSPEHPHGQVFAGASDLSPHLRLPEVDAHVSLLAQVPAVRVIMVEAQRRIAGEGGVVMAGRDIGTVVLPGAPLKVYLDASVEERARRRFEELEDRDPTASYDQVLEDLERRDDVDSGREASPLRPAGDALILQTDGLPPEAVARAIVDAARCVAPPLSC